MMLIQNADKGKIKVIIQLLLIILLNVNKQRLPGIQFLNTIRFTWRNGN